MRAIAVIFLAVLAAGARAGDASAAPPDSISDAKKNLASIKAPLNQQDAPGALQSFEMKDVGPLPGSTRAELPAISSKETEASLDLTKKQAGTGNWLVDSMDGRSDTSRIPGDRGKDGLPGADQKGAQAEREGALSGEAQAKSGAKGTLGAVYNPLENFMDGWISAKDHDLLLPSSKGEGIAGVDMGRIHSDLLPGLEIESAGSPIGNGMGQDTLGFSESSKSAPNPYLALMELSPSPQSRSFSAPDGQGPSLPGLPEFSRGISSSGVDPRPVGGERNIIPDFAQLPDDDKYFKQMKRF